MQTPTNLENAPTFASSLETWLCGHKEALDFCRDILLISARWDDLIDKDQIVLEQDIHTFAETLLSLPCNSFYMQHFTQLFTLLHNSIRNWKVSLQLERNSDDDYKLNIAYIIRSSYVDIIAHCAALIKGSAWAEGVAREARLLVHSEGFDTYKSALKRESEVRNGMRL